MRLAVLLAVIGAPALASAEPARTLPAPPHLPLRMTAITIERIAERPRPVLLPIAPASRGIDDDLERLVTRAGALVARLTGRSHRLGGYVHVENVASSEATAPRVIVLGLRIGADDPASEALPFSRR